MITRIGNLILASLFLLMIVGRDWRWAGSPAPTPYSSMPLYGIVLTGIVYIWFLAAMILFFRSRLAWLACLAGVGLAVVCFAWISMSIFGECFFPNAQALHDRETVGTVTSILALLTGFSFFGVCLALSVGLFIGLVKMRRDLRLI